MDIYLPFKGNLQKRFCRTKQYGDTVPTLPHPIGLNTDNLWQAKVRNDLRTSGVGYTIRLPKGAELHSPIEGEVVDVRRHPAPRLLSFYGIHQTNLVQIEGKDGIVRLEHVLPQVSKGQRVTPNTVIGTPFGGAGSEHLHLYGVFHPDDKQPGKTVSFVNLESGLQNVEYDSMEIALRLHFPHEKNWRKRSDQFVDGSDAIQESIEGMAIATELLTNQMRDSIFKDPTEAQLIRCLRGAGYRLR